LEDLWVANLRARKFGSFYASKLFLDFLSIRGQKQYCDLLSTTPPATDRSYALTLALGRQVLLVFADHRGLLLKAARWPQPYLRLEKLLVVSRSKAIYLSAPLSEHIGFVNAGSSFSYPTNH
jgi:hypothetical protein